MGFNDSLLKFNPKLFNYYEQKAKQINANLGRNSPNKQIDKSSLIKTGKRSALKAHNVTMDEKNPYDSLTSNGIVGANSSRRNSNEGKLVDPKFGNFRGAKQSV